jgi:2-polyprenyl-3-methyl-5-hydroxy-6-metoxy-1,4-benzoquinol methylase
MLVKVGLGLAACTFQNGGVSSLGAVKGGQQSIGGESAESSNLEPRSTSIYQAVTGDDVEDDRGYWDSLYNTERYVFGREPSVFLRSQLGVLPRGRVLDIAMGEGRNGVFLAKFGFEVEGVDLSDVALRKARRLARDQGVSIHTVLSDMSRFKIRHEYYTVILNINFLDRGIIPAIKQGLRPGGMVLFENPTVEQLRNPGGQGVRRDYLLEQGELRTLFSDLEILVYQESNDGKNAVAQLLARKR